MARIASQSKGGFYATPPEELTLACQKLKTENNPIVNLLDPCCGEGDALKQIADSLDLLGATSYTYGVELEDGRAEEAKKVLTKVIKGGYETMRASNEVFSFMWLNPPYDDGRNNERTEVTFLRSLTEAGKYLQAGGLLGFCIPQYVLADCAVLLANRLDGIKVYRFTDKNYPVYKQVIVFGYRRKSRNDPSKARLTRDELTALGKGSKDNIPEINVDDGIFFNVPKAEGEVKQFRGYFLDAVEIFIDIEKSTAWTDFDNLQIPLNLRNDAVLKSPVLPLKAAHMGTAIAAGAVGGNMTNHILVGTTSKVTDKSAEISEHNEHSSKEISIERHITKMRIYSQHEGAKGVYNLD